MSFMGASRRVGICRQCETQIQMETSLSNYGISSFIVNSDEGSKKGAILSSSSNRLIIRC